MNVEILTWTSESGCGESRTHCVRVRCGAVGVAYGVCASQEDEVMTQHTSATERGSGTQVLLELWRPSLPKPGEHARVTPQEATHTRVRKDLGGVGPRIADPAGGSHPDF